MGTDLNTLQQDIEEELRQPPQSDNDLNFYFTPYTVDVIGLDNPLDIRNYDNKFKYISGEIEKIIYDFSTAEFIEERLTITFRLSPEQKITVTRIIRDVLLNYIFIGDMPKEIQARLKVDQDTASKITAMIVSQLFGPAIEEIKKAQSTAFPNRLDKVQQLENQPMSPTIDLRNPAPTTNNLPTGQAGQQPIPPPKNTFYNPASSLDVNKNNVLDLRNNQQQTTDN